MSWARSVSRHFTARGVAGPERGGERVDAGLDERDQLRPDRVAREVVIGEVEDAPVGGLDLGLGLGRDLREQVPRAMDQAALAGEEDP